MPKLSVWYCIVLVKIISNYVSHFFSNKKLSYYPESQIHLSILPLYVQYLLYLK